MIDPLVQWIPRLGLGLIFLLSGLSKLLDREAFRQGLRHYRLLPASLEAPVSVAVPSLELLGALLLLVRPEKGGLLILGLLALFSMAIFWGLGQGGGFNCGCLGGIEEPLSPWLFLRNGLLGLLAVPTLLPATPRPLTAADLVVVGLGSLFVLFAYLGLSLLLANAVRLSELRRS